MKCPCGSGKCDNRHNKACSEQQQQQRVVGRPCDVTDATADQEKGHGTPYIILK